MVKNTKTHRWLLGMALWAGVVSVAGCGYLDQAATCDDGMRDWELETFGIALPAPGPVDLGRLPMSLIEPHYVGPFRMVAQLARGDFAGVQAHWQSVAALEDPTEQMRAVVRTLDALEGRGLAVLNQAQAWQAREPDSPAAQLMLAAAFAHAARSVNQENWDPVTTHSHFRRLDNRVQAAAQGLAPLLARNDVYGRAAKELNLGVGFQEGNPEFEQAWIQYLTLIDFAPGYEWLYLRAADYAAPATSSGEAPQRFQTLQDLAKARNLPDIHQTTLRQKIEARIQPPETNPNPQAWRPYWEARVQAAPTVSNWVAWMRAEQGVNNWPKLLDITQQIIDLHPHHRYAWETRSWALANMGRLQASYDAAMVAITLGSDWAMNRVIQGYARGEMGLPYGDYDALIAHCRFGATMALSAATNCMGSAYTDGFGGIERDNKVALGWHFLGARGGHFNSQHDVAVLLPKVVTNPEMAGAIDDAAGHWLRRAVSQNHQPARNKLDARPEWGRVCAPVDSNDRWRMIYKFMRSILG